MPDHQSSSKPESKASTDQVISFIKQNRDTLVTALLSDEVLLSFAEDHFETIALSPIKIEFLKRDLKELRSTPLDLVHYATLIRDHKEGAPNQPNHLLILTEIFTIFKKYGLEQTGK